MARALTASRDGHALLDPLEEIAARRVDADDIAAFHAVGRHLLRAAERDGRRDAAAAAVEDFREAIEVAPADPSAQNSLGVALLALSRFESHASALDLLGRARQAFQAASALAQHQAAPRSACLRYSINLATVEWIYGERTADNRLIGHAEATLQSAAQDLSSLSPHWAHVQDNLGNALAALGRLPDAIAAFERTLSSQHSDHARARSLNNLGVAHAEAGSYADAVSCHTKALALLSRDGSSLAWGLTQHNLGSALLQAALANQERQPEADTLLASVQAFRAAKKIRLRTRTPLEWAATTVNMASALLGLGTYLCTEGGASDAGLGNVREAIRLYREALAELPEADLKRTLNNLLIASQVLAKLSPTEATRSEVRALRHDLRTLASSHGLTAIAEQIRGEVDGSPPNWPAETYAQAHKQRKEDIVQFLTRVWLPLIQAGAVDLPTLRARDPSAAKAVDNFRQRKDPITGVRRELPPPLDIPTKRERNDRLAANIPLAGDRPARLDWALRARARRSKKKV